MTPETLNRRTKHEELTQTLRELVNQLPPGERLPSQTELMRRFSVSDRTVLRSLEDLRRDGWIVRRRGSGTFVADPRSRSRTPMAMSSPPERQTIAALALTPSPSPFYQRCLDLLAERVEAAECSLVCHHARHDSDSHETLPLEALQPRGFVVLNFTLYEVAQHLQARGHRTVILGAPPADLFPAVPCVFGDHEYGGYLATRHLLELGHQRLGYLRFTPTSGASLRRSFRWRGHERALREAQRRDPAVACRMLDAETLTPWRSDPSLAAAFFRGPAAPTGVIVWNDREALWLLSILQHAGVRVPEDVSIVGYDALPEAAECFPPLSTVDQHLGAQIRAVIDLLSRPSSLPQTHSVVVVPDLVAGASCAPPRAS